MATAKARFSVPSAVPTASPTIRGALTTCVDSQSPVTDPRNRTARTQYDLWQNLIDQLIKWGMSPAHVDEEEWESPSVDAVNSAYRLVAALRENGRPVPLRVVSNGEGGIIFERKEGSTAETFEIDADGSIEYIAYANSRLVSRRDLELE